MMQFISKAMSYGPVITTPSPLLSAEVSFPYSTQLNGQLGTPPYSWSVIQGSVPTGLALLPTGQITGTPTGSGLFLFAVEITDARGAISQPMFYQLTTVIAVTIITSSPLPSGTQGVAYSTTLAANGGATPYSWALTSGTLDSGLGLNAVSGVISGTPANAETDTPTFTVTDALGNSVSKAFSLTINSSYVAPTITTTSPLPGATVGIAYSFQMQAINGTLPYVWSLSSDTGTNTWAVSSGGLVTGTPTGAETDTLNIKLVDAHPTTVGPQAFSLTVAVAGLAYPLTQAPFFPSGTGTSSTAFQQAVSKLNYVQLYAYGGISGSFTGGQTNASVMASIKSFAASLYPGHTVKTGLYQIDNGWWQFTSTSGETDSLKTNACNNNLGWRLQQTPGVYPSGTTSSTLNETNTGYLTNNDGGSCPKYTFANNGSILSASSVFGGPVNLSQWTMWYEIQCWLLGNANAIGAGFTEPANPSLDFIAHDNQYLYSRWFGYYNSDTTYYSPSNHFSGNNNAQAIVVRGLLASGQASAVALMQQMTSQITMVGNVDAMSYFGDAGCPPTTDAPKL